ncbi:hypothetical protein [Halomontanus rarus]|uniref:hypothetical protein n=1 Tax=Halomontanus rarus TaxID=3034020 RepID=UPI0023E82CA6|nr:hypothetical protein [Halovivax sp. TS33]
MAAVNLVNGVTYGFRLFGYLIGVSILGLLPLGLGYLLMDGAPLVGALLMLFGFLVFYAGSFGLFYKVIADAVSAGVSDVSSPADEPVVDPAPDLDPTTTDSP